MDITCAADVILNGRRREWGPWVLDRENYLIFLPSSGNDTTNHDNGFLYYVDFEECTTSARVLDRIAQITGKNWAEDNVLAGLIRALDDVLYLQAHLCGCGMSATITKAKARSLVESAR